MARKKAKKISRKPHVNITITIADGSAHPDPAPISLGRHEVAHWKTKPPKRDFLVVFEGATPFKDWSYDRHRPTSSTAHGNPETTYKYTVYTTGGAVKSDPGIIIKP
jgi:hypothetical protein